MKIIDKCGGLPLAVKVMGGLLSTKSQSEHVWEAVLNHRVWSVDGLPEELDTRIYLSYEDLSPQLKQCFLYCSLFPKGTIIWQSDVVPMWIAEGFIQPHHSGKDDRLEETAIDYYEELVTRNLIESTSKLANYSCTIHDVVRSFAGFMAREDSLVMVQLDSSRQAAAAAAAAGGGRNNSDDSSLVVRRMAVGPSELLVPEWDVIRKQESSLRTLIIHCKINFGPNDSLASFSRLRVLSINQRGGGRDCDGLVGSLCQLRHLRYICLERTNVSRLPEDIHMMKFLQHILLGGSTNLENLPSSIIKLVHLRTLVLEYSNANVVIPQGFGGLTNLRMLLGFPVHTDTDGGWCSLEEIEPLSQLRKLSLHGLENVPPSSLAENKAMVSRKEHLDYLQLKWSSSGWMELRDELVKQHRQHVVAKVLEKLCPPPSVQHLIIEGYFGGMLPSWMTVRATEAYKSLMMLKLEDLPCCTRLPDGLCRLPSLKALDIRDAPAIKSVGSEFQASSSSSMVAFPNLTTLNLEGLSEWEQWDWEDVTAHVMAMPSLEGLGIDNCKLSRLPPGLANNRRRALRRLNLYELSNLTAVENFPSLVELDVFDCPELRRISGLSRLHKIRVICCPKLEVLDGVPALDSLELEDGTMEALPGYLTCVSPRFLKLRCSKEVYESIISGSSSECDKIRHIAKRDINYIEDSDAALHEYSDED
jgi:Leucine-rich repeat (LRR) protein